MARSTRTTFARRLAVVATVMLASSLSAQSAWAGASSKSLAPSFDSATSDGWCGNYISPTTDTYACQHDGHMTGLSGGSNGTSSVQSTPQNYPASFAWAEFVTHDAISHAVPSQTYTAVIHLNSAHTTTSLTGVDLPVFNDRAFAYTAFWLRASMDTCSSCGGLNVVQAAASSVTVAGGSDSQSVSDKDITVVMTLRNGAGGNLPAGKVTLTVRTECLASALTSVSTFGAATCAYDSQVASVVRG
jgi:hypothetical protein